jgi:signal transduction histidine kinase
MRRLTLWQSMSLAFGLMATVMMVVIGAAYYATTTILVQRTLQRTISQTAQELIENHLIFQDGQIRYKRAETGLTIAGFLRGTGVSAMIFDRQLNRIGTYGLYRNLVDQQLLEPAIPVERLERALVTGKSEFHRARYGALQSPYEVVVVPIALTDEVVGILQMSITASPLEQLQFLTGYLILTILPISLVIMWLVSFYLGRTWLQPLYRLIALMQATETHRLVDLPKLPTTPYPEIDTLQSALRGLLSRIRKQMVSQQQFSAHAAHELKTPLAQAVSELDVALPLATQPELAAHIQTVKQDLLHLNRTLESVMALSLLEAKQHTFKPHLISLEKVITQALEPLKTMAEKQGVTVTIAVSPEHQWLMVPDHAVLLFRNVISNAIKYNKRKGTVTITSQLHRRAIQVMVADTGIGIGKKEQPHVFRHFFRAKAAPEIPGYGIGLTLVYSIAERSRLAIRIESEPQKGTTVHISQLLKAQTHGLAR